MSSPRESRKKTSPLKTAATQTYARYYPEVNALQGQGAKREEPPPKRRLTVRSSENSERGARDGVRTGTPILPRRGKILGLASAEAALLYSQLQPGRFAPLGKCTAPSGDGKPLRSRLLFRSLWLRTRSVFRLLLRVEGCDSCTSSHLNNYAAELLRRKYYIKKRTHACAGRMCAGESARTGLPWRDTRALKLISWCRNHSCRHAAR